jgi:hypothetical protein
MGNCMTKPTIIPDNKAIKETDLITDFDDIFTTYYDNMKRSNGIKIRSFSKQKYRKELNNGVVIAIEKTE